MPHPNDQLMQWLQETDWFVTLTQEEQGQYADWALQTLREEWFAELGVADSPLLGRVWLERWFHDLEDDDQRAIMGVARLLEEQDWFAEFDPEQLAEGVRHARQQQPRQWPPLLQQIWMTSWYHRMGPQSQEQIRAHVRALLGQQWFQNLGLGQQVELSQDLVRHELHRRGLRRTVRLSFSEMPDYDPNRPVAPPAGVPIDSR